MKYFLLLASIFLHVQSVFAQVVPCAPGEFWDTSMNMCMPIPECPAGQTWDASMNMCMPDTLPAPTPTCPAGEVWDASMNMCMPATNPAPAATPACPSGQIWDTSMSMCMPVPTPSCPVGQAWDASMNMCMPSTPTNPNDPHNCGPGQAWDTSMSMCMPIGDPNSRKPVVGFHINQFVVRGVSTGPRGRNDFYAPNMWMLTVDQRLSVHNKLRVSFMGTTDKWTVPQNGSPELFQTGEANNAGVPFLDAQHPHSSPIMGLTFSDILTLNSAGDHKLIFYFAPRGEAASGPEAFMHRASSVGNPYAPLGHHLQDWPHIASTVVGTRYEDGKNTIEGSAFSGQEPQPQKVNLDMHKVDSWAARYSRQVSPIVNIGGSIARVAVNPRVPEAGEPAGSHAEYYSMYAGTNSKTAHGILSTESIWGMAYNETTRQSLNSFLSEFVYQLGRNNFFGRMEVVQRSSDQLEIQLSNPEGEVHWIKAVTFGYEHKIGSPKGINLFAGGSMTQNFTPKAFVPTYGSAPVGVELHLRVNFVKGQNKKH